MTRWLRIQNDMLDDYACQKLDGELFKHRFMAAIAGENNEFSRFVSVDPQGGRLSRQIWSALRNKIFKRDDYLCGYCGVRGGRLECDHRHPISRGGSNDEDNLITACFECNRAKSAMTEAEWRNARGIQ